MINKRCPKSSNPNWSVIIMVITKLDSSSHPENQTPAVTCNEGESIGRLKYLIRKLESDPVVMETYNDIIKTQLKEGSSRKRTVPNSAPAIRRCTIFHISQWYVKELQVINYVSCTVHHQAEMESRSTPVLKLDLHSKIFCGQLLWGIGHNRYQYAPI